eukprot:3618848-Rhodomonas_salina.1
MGGMDKGRSGSTTILTYGSHLSIFVVDRLYDHTVNSSRVTISGADPNTSTVTESLLRNVSAESDTQGAMGFTQESGDLFCRQLNAAPESKDTKPSEPVALSRLSLPNDASPAFCRAGVGIPELSGLRAWVEQNRDVYQQGLVGLMRRNHLYCTTWNQLRRPTRPDKAQIKCYICSELHNTRQCRLRGAITEAVSEWRDLVFQASQTMEARRTATENLIGTELAPGLAISENQPPLRNPRSVSWLEPAGTRVSDRPEPVPLLRVALSAESTTIRTTKHHVEHPRLSQMGQAALHDTAPGERTDMAAGAQPVTQCSAVPAPHSVPNNRNVRSRTEQRHEPTLGLERELVGTSSQSRQQIALVMFTGSDHGSKTLLIKSIINCYQSRPNTAVMVVNEASTTILRSFGSGAVERLTNGNAARAFQT